MKRARVLKILLQCRRCSTSPVGPKIDNDQFKTYIRASAGSDIHNTLTAPDSSASLLSPSDTFAERHLGSSGISDIEKMCLAMKVTSIDDLIRQTIPEHVMRDQTIHPLHLTATSQSESQCVAELAQISEQNVVGTNFLGQGYHGTITPGVIQRNLLENPAWYTAYTPYQAEISQGRLEALFVFQTLVTNLTGMDVANCSLLDEGSAAAEAMAMFARAANAPKRKIFLVSHTVHPQTISVVQTRAKWMGIDCRVVDIESFNISAESSGLSDTLLGALVQYPDTTGLLRDYTELGSAVHALKGKLCVAADPLALTVCKPPSEFGADAVVGTMQRFGVPLWFGGPHAGFLSAQMSDVRRMPGRLVGESIDAESKKALRLTLQTREQHIRLDKATSNICTSQALLANMSGMYAVYHGPAGLQRIACRVHGLAQLFSREVSGKGLGTVVNGENVFDAVTVDIAPNSALRLKEELNERYQIQIRVLSDSVFQVSFDETHLETDADRLVESISVCLDGQPKSINPTPSEFPVDGLVPLPFRRTGALLPQRIFNSIQTESEMMRYLYRLQLKDLSLTASMITLGSCTMKLNSVSSLVACSWPGIANIHPFAPKANTKGYKQILDQLSEFLCTITSMEACSLQPPSGASGEYAGLLAIRRFQIDSDEAQRNVVLVPRSAHGTNSASAAMMGLSVKWIDDAEGSGLDLAELRTVCESLGNSLSALMITYPSTRGVFEENIREICDIVHQHGGQVYMDGANMNAQLGLTAPGLLGADVCHLNLHKTFSIPHGGGGPGMGPICARAHLGPFLPGHPFADSSLSTTSDSVSSAPFGQAGIAVIPWMFIRMLGARGLTDSGKQAILNANYMASRLSGFYPMPFLNKHGRCSHEFIIDVSGIKETTGIAEEDIAKRLMDYGFHAPTMSWPVHASLMIEPTESENIGELDRFVEAMIQIREEIRRIETGEYSRTDNPLKNAPHTQATVCGTEWNRGYSREVAAFPLPWVLERGKFWPTVARVNNSVGDKDLILTLKE